MVCLYNITHRTPSISGRLLPLPLGRARTSVVASRLFVRVPALDLNWGGTKINVGGRELEVV